MFRRLDDSGGVWVSIRVDGARIEAREGEPLAAALLAAGVSSFGSTAVGGTPRGPFCLMGACFDCLVEIDGVANVQACMEAVRDGMIVRFQHGARRPSTEHPDSA